MLTRVLVVHYVLVLGHMRAHLNRLAIVVDVYLILDASTRLLLV